MQWEFVHGLLENAIYGGRIDNYFDLRVLQSYLKQFFNSSVIDILNEMNKKSIFPYTLSLPKSCSILVSKINPCQSITRYILVLFLILLNICCFFLNAQVIIIHKCGLFVIPICSLIL